MPVERVVDRMWRDAPPASAAKIVHIAVGRLRTALDGADPGSADLLRTTAAGYVLAAAPDDLAEYEDACTRVERLRSTRPDDALAALAEAFAAWAGRPWGDEADADWLRDRVGAIEEQHRDLEETWADLMLERDRAAEAIEVFRARP